MSKVLLIRHLPTTLSLEEKEQLLKYFGAIKVWETSPKRNYVFASFPSVEQAKHSLARLHQLEIAQRRLVVEYSIEKEPVAQKQDFEQSSTATIHVQEFLKALNAWNPSVDFYQPPPAHIKYKYPDITPNIGMNIIYALFHHKPFYVQTIHLMNKMCMDTPFQDDKRAFQYFRETFRQFFADIVPIAVPRPESEPESEMSGEETEHIAQPTPRIQRKRTLVTPIKTAAAILSTASLPKVKKTKQGPVNQKDVFETAPIQEPKKIYVCVPQHTLPKEPQETEVVGELGKFSKEYQPAPVENAPEPELPTITKSELLRNRIKYSDMKMLGVYRQYNPGEPSMRLYIKNLSKTVTEADVKRIYRRYVESLPEEEQMGFDVRVMQEGRMKGQAFVTFPTIELAETALHETNGYLLKERPLVVQFARAANKKM